MFYCKMLSYFKHLFQNSITQHSNTTVYGPINEHRVESKPL